MAKITNDDGTEVQFDNSFWGATKRTGAAVAVTAAGTGLALAGAAGLKRLFSKAAPADQAKAAFRPGKVLKF